MLIAEELLLLALDEKGRLGLSSAARLKHALTGALLAELAIDGCLTITPNGSVQPTATSPGDALLAQVYGEVGHLAGEHAQGAVRDIGVSGGYRQDVICRLVNAGVLGRRRPAPGRTQYPVLDAAVHQATLNAARSAVNAGEPMTPRIAVILALAGTCGLARQVAPDRGSREEVRKRMSRATAEAPFSPEVARTIDTLVAAVHALTAAAGDVQ